MVEAHPIRCSHFDAFRFFTPPAVDRNRLQYAQETASWSSRSCLHAGMDLYKWAYKLSPATPGELVADCFELAVEIRELDMQASPYDLREHGYEPVAIETPEEGGLRRRAAGSPTAGLSSEHASWPSAMTSSSSGRHRDQEPSPVS